MPLTGADEEHAEYEEPDRQAMRAYLQRAEVRSSTMHRIAVGFISGAGLLVLFPVLLSNAISDVIKYFVINFDWSLSATNISFMLLWIPFLATLFVPLYSMYLLFKELVTFYYSSHLPGFSSTKKNHPGFTLMSIAFSPDESVKAKRHVLTAQYGQDDLIDYVISPVEREARIYDQVKNSLPLRSIENLTKDGIISQNHKETDSFFIHTDPKKEKKGYDIKRFNAALGLAGARDKWLTDEVAKMEVSLGRTVLYLRRLVFRYFKALLMLILTALVSFVILPFIEVTPEDITHFDEYNSLYAVSILYLLWSILAFFVVRLPIRWVEKTATNKNAELVPDLQLKSYENKIRWVVFGAGISSLVALLIVLIA